MWKLSSSSLTLLRGVSRCPSTQSAVRRSFGNDTPRKMNVLDLVERVDLTNQPVLVRVDLNVPLDKEDPMKISDDTRLRAIASTTNLLLQQQAKVILMSHFGRPKGEIIETGKNGRLTPLVEPMQELLNVKVTKLNDCIGSEVEQAVQESNGGEIVLLENTRFHAGETKNDPVLSQQLGQLADYFVMDAFGTAHRAHSSTVGVCQHMKYNVAGTLLQKELDFLINTMQDPTKKPRVAIVGGSKISTKLPVLSNLLTKCDTILIGGAMMFTFYKALGYNVGDSLVEDDMVELAKQLMEQAKESNVPLILPKDVVVADAFSNDANTAIASASDIQDGWRGLDIGPETIEEFNDTLQDAQCVVWNGPLGAFEMESFSTGTNQVAQILDGLTKQGVTTIVGGGDSVAAVQGTGAQVSHISTGGGASLELLEGKVLPGVEALTDA